MNEGGIRKISFVSLTKANSHQTNECQSFEGIEMQCNSMGTSLFDRSISNIS